MLLESFDSGSFATNGMNIHSYKNKCAVAKEMIKQMDKKGGETYGIIAVFNSGSDKGLTKKPAAPFLMELGAG
ncbi:hypothetical protein [Peribacillus sp. CSMR9]|uniref:hypothetical protein n=1 Tax=Peribacillus sp. CSMR9 TaxID=2981350 RepID=UPI0029545092|nr:hypothetical protein [Peribacillus sp. CSMR9]